MMMSSRVHSRAIDSRSATRVRSRARSRVATRGCEKNPSTSAPRAPTRTIELAVEMRCQTCADRVVSALASIPDASDARATLSTNTAVVRTSANSSDVVRAIERAGYRCRVIGAGDGDAFGDALAAALGTDARTLRQSLAAVAEFKGEAYGHGRVRGTVRLVQVSEAVILCEASLDGVRPRARFRATIREYGDTTGGLASAGGVYANGGDSIGILTSDANGSVKLPATLLSEALKTWDVIGRSVAVESVDDDDVAVVAVLARSAGVGENHKKLCQCDGTVIWEAGEDFLPVVVPPAKAGGPLLGRGVQTVRRMDG